MSNIKELKQKVKTLKVLFVDDEKDIRVSMGIFLNKIFNDVTVCSNGQDGFDTFNKTNDFDIVITDMLMPKMNGIEMIEKIKEINPEIFTIFVTASKEDALTNNLSDAYLKKPISYKEITNVIEIIGNTL